MVSIAADEAISLLSFYLALVALICTIFFNKLEDWYNEARIAVSSWEEEDKANPVIKTIKNHQLAIRNLHNASPIIGFVFVLIFLGTVTYFGVALNKEISESTIPLTFIWIPGAIFELIFVVVSIALFIDGKRKLNKASSQIESAINPKKL